MAHKKLHTAHRPLSPLSSRRPSSESYIGCIYDCYLPRKLNPRLQCLVHTDPTESILLSLTHADTDLIFNRLFRLCMCLISGFGTLSCIYTSLVHATGTRAATKNMAKPKNVKTRHLHVQFFADRSQAG